jgi:Xaa-Pro aminopeptidase
MTVRLDRLRSLLEERGLDGILITDPWNRFYLSGYTAEDHAPNESSGIALVGPAVTAMFVSPNNTEWAASEASDFEVIGVKRPWTTGIANRIARTGWRKVGFEDHAMLFSTHRDLSKALADKVELVPVGGAIDDLRIIKDAEELQTLERVISITDRVMTETVSSLQPGMTEREIAWRTESAYRDAGADGVGFPTSVASGPHAARPHHSPSDRAIQEGEPIIIDMGARLGGYNGDLTRTVWLGVPSPQLKNIYNIVFEAHATALAGLRAGVSAKEGDALSRRIIDAAGYGDRFPYGLGHGLGLRVHEGPWMSTISAEILQSRQVVTVEPGIYLPGWGGVRIEDVVEITDGGCRVLTKAPKNPPQ